MKTIYLIFIILLIGCAEHNQNDFNNDNWTNKDQLTFNVELSEVDVLKDSILSGSKNSYQAKLEVIELGETNTIKWHILIPNRKPDSLLTQLEKLKNDTLEYSEILQIVYQTNRAGQYLQILNWPTIEKYNDSIWNNQFKEYLIDTSKQELLAKFKSTFASQPAIEARLTRDILALHLMYMSKFSNSENETQEIAAGINNAQTPTTIKSKILENYDERAIVRIAFELDLKEIKNQVNEFIDQFVHDSVSNDISIRDTALIEFNKNSGWPKHVEYWRISSVGDRKKQTGVSLKQVKH